VKFNGLGVEFKAPPKKQPWGPLTPPLVPEYALHANPSTRPCSTIPDGNRVVAQQVWRVRNVAQQGRATTS
jgi:hypothetical protein